MMTENPFLKESPLPYQLPPFDRIKDSDYRPAFEAGMGEQLREVATIAHNPKAADFENTFVALEFCVYFRLAPRSEFSEQARRHTDSKFCIGTNNCQRDIHAQTGRRRLFYNEL
jgi:Zn-dependent oligopeptidase